MNAAAKLLDYLERVRARGSDQWSASCPGPLHEHGDRSGGLAIRQVDDRVLIFCPAGCTASEIMAAVGLSLADLYDRPLNSTGVAPVRQAPFPTLMAERLFKSALIVLLAADDLRHGRALDDADFQSVQRAFETIDEIVIQHKNWPRERRR